MWVCAEPHNLAYMVRLSNAGFGTMKDLILYLKGWVHSCSVMQRILPADGHVLVVMICHQLQARMCAVTDRATNQAMYGLLALQSHASTLAALWC